MGMFDQWMAARRQSPHRAMERRVKVQLGEFTLASMQDLSERRRVTLDAVVRQATLFYLSDREASRSWRYPRFVKRWPGTRLDLTVKLDENLVREASAEADRQEVPLERLLEHAVLYYLAGLAKEHESGQEG